MASPPSLCINRRYNFIDSWEADPNGTYLRTCRAEKRIAFRRMHAFPIAHVFIRCNIL